jgi:hypothetical protein
LPALVGLGDDDDDDDVMIIGESVPLRDGELQKALRSSGAAAAVAGAAKAGEVVVLLDGSQPDGLGAQVTTADGKQVVSCRAVMKVLEAMSLKGLLEGCGTC